jgi:hypothetical protein
MVEVAVGQIAIGSGVEPRKAGYTKNAAGRMDRRDDGWWVLVARHVPLGRPSRSSLRTVFDASEANVDCQTSTGLYQTLPGGNPGGAKTGPMLPGPKQRRTPDESSRNWSILLTFGPPGLGSSLH